MSFNRWKPLNVEGLNISANPLNQVLGSCYLGQMKITDNLQKKLCGSLFTLHFLFALLTVSANHNSWPVHVYLQSVSANGSHIVNSKWNGLGIVSVWLFYMFKSFTLFSANAKAMGSQLSKVNILKHWPKILSLGFVRHHIHTTL